jgi:hypothetical protein
MLALRTCCHACSMHFGRGVQPSGELNDRTVGDARCKSKRRIAASHTAPGSTLAALKLVLA